MQRSWRHVSLVSQYGGSIRGGRRLTDHSTKVPDLSLFWPWP